MNSLNTDDPIRKAIISLHASGKYELAHAVWDLLDDHKARTVADRIESTRPQPVAGSRPFASPWPTTINGERLTAAQIDERIYGSASVLLGGKNAGACGDCGSTAFKHECPADQDPTDDDAAKYDTACHQCRILQRTEHDWNAHCALHCTTGAGPESCSAHN